MRRFVSVLILILLILPLGLSVRAQEAVTPVTTAQELMALGDRPEGSYRLEADIDLSGISWTPISFRGSLDGAGHTVYNLQVLETGADTGETVDGNFKKYDTRFAGLFSKLEGAEIRDLHILGADVEITTDDHCFAAMLAGSATDTVIENCSASGSVRLYTTNKMVGTGGLVGFGHGTIRNCTVDAELTFADRSDRDSGLRCEQFMGGLVGTGAFDLLDNRVNIRGYDSCYGFVHNGGLNGMHYCYTGVGNRDVIGNHVEGIISFFEHNPQRRAYCAPFIGEALPRPRHMKDNSENFVRDEQKDAVSELLPHSCENPQWQDNVVPHSDTEFGYTEHICGDCGYSCRSGYVAPGHVEGDWVTEKVRTYDQEGLMTRKCTVCGQIIESQSMPMLVPVESCLPDLAEADLAYRESLQLKVQVLPEDADNKKLTWTSSNPDVAMVDGTGKVTATGRGTADILCRSEDGFAESKCTVTVHYTPTQWLIQTLLLGFLWY